MSNDNSLKQQLKEKEQLVAALTERLELAAEQLDRFQRMGADRGGRSSGGGGGGFPTELIDKHESLVEDLQHAVQQWNEMQAGMALGRLENQLADLQDLVASNLSGDRSPTRRSGEGDSSSQDSQNASDGFGEENPAGEPEGDRWEALKSYLLDADEEQADSPSQPTLGSDAGTAAEDVGKISSAQPDVPEIEAASPHEAVNSPSPIDDDESDVTVLRTAVATRDDYIVFLLRKLRHAGSQPQLPPNWDELDGKPETLCRQVEELQSQLTESLRLSELEHSLERARLGREDVRIRQLEENTRKTMRQLGLGPELDGEEEIEQQQDEGTGNRWLKMLGICGDEDDDEDDE